MGTGDIGVAKVLLTLAEKLGMQLETDNDGQIIIYTGLEQDPDTDKLVEFKSKEN